jgi:ATP-dependent Lon protease
MITGYTREAGVRELERQTNTVARKIATEVVNEEIETGKKFQVNERSLEKYLGPLKFDRENIESNKNEIGLVNGLAWTSVGGEVLNVEVVTVPGTGKIEVTGKLGEVMQESAKAAMSYVRSIASRVGIEHSWFQKNDVHIHVPEGATPKDGPSAGITLATALTSAITGIAVKQNVAMTGEITLRGRVLPIGGVKEKLLAAKQAGITTVIIPQKNEKNLVKVPDEIKNGLDIVPVSQCEDVLKTALHLNKPEEFMKIVKPLKVIEGEGSGKQVAN